MGSMSGNLTARKLGTIGVITALALVLLSSLVPAPAAAHPLGNFTINRYARLEFAKDAVRVVYVLDFAEIPTFQQLEILDTDGNATVSDAEAERYLDEVVPM